MKENQERRKAHRQRRGLQRVEEILDVAGKLFADVGYDKTTTNMIAAKVGMSPGSLYQFFLNKEAITLAFATDATQQLHAVYDAMLALSMSLSLSDFINELIGRLTDFNRNNAGYLAIELASTVSPELALILKDLHQGVYQHLDSVFAARWPKITAEQRYIPLLISYRLFYSLLPSILQNDKERSDAIIKEMKTCLYRYWEPIVGA